MHSSLTATYLIPALLLNPVLFLHSLNTILSRILPPIVAQTTTQPAPYSRLGPSANYPHLDVHASDNLCWSYTALMVCAQLVAFGRVSRSRAEGKERRERKEQTRLAAMNGNGNGNGNGNCNCNGKLVNGNGHLNGHEKGLANGKANGAPHRDFWDDEDEYDSSEPTGPDSETTEEEMVF